MQRAMTVTSALILLYLAAVLFGLPLGMAVENPNSLVDMFLITLAAVPGIILLVTAYRQLIQQRRGLIMLSSLAFIATVAVLILSLYLGKDDYAELQTILSEKLTPEDLDLIMPNLEIKKMIYLAVLNSSLLIVPIFTNFRKLDRDSGIA